MGTGTAIAVDPFVASCTLTPRFEAVRAARDFARTTLQGWGLGALFDDVALVASELVTNALRHAIGTSADDTGGPLTQVPAQPLRSHSPQASQSLQLADGRMPIRISLVHRSPQVVCAVSDPSSQGPVAREADFVAESGRGLHLVDSFSSSWGWHPLAGAGKVVWALFDAAPAEPVAGRHRRAV
ncbi:ATP-binding protein [Kitasatospora sp. NPDC059571]|uniref:ATP-binding protein n=1 Tax=Kitasatospora sp. NPDC059571 TaxID=3346871 RepID=UPI0036C0B317